MKPVVMLGSNGLTEGVLAEIEQALEHHELIKVKIAAEESETKTLIADAIVRESGANKIQVIGNIPGAVPAGCRAENYATPLTSSFSMERCTLRPIGKGHLRPFAFLDKASCG